jgi:hypothetical protein
MTDTNGGTGVQRQPIIRVSLTHAREHMQECDLILCRGSYGISKLFEDLTKRKYSHAAVVARWGHMWMLCQAEAGGVQAVPLHITVGKYNGAVYWYRLTREARERLNIERTVKEVKRDLGVAYGYGPVLRDMAYRYLGFKYLGMRKPEDTGEPNSMFCSQYVAHCFRAGGLPLCDHTDINTLPADIESSPYVQYVATIHQAPNEEATSAVAVTHTQAASAGGA